MNVLSICPEPHERCTPWFHDEPRRMVRLARPKPMDRLRTTGSRLFGVSWTRFGERPVLPHNFLPRARTRLVARDVRVLRRHLAGYGSSAVSPVLDRGAHALHQIVSLRDNPPRNPATTCVGPQGVSGGVQFGRPEAATYNGECGGREEFDPSG